MILSLRSLPAAAAVMVAAMLASSAAHAQSDVVTHAKKNNRGTILPDGISPAEISLDMAGVLRKFPVNEVTKVAFGEDPTELTSARNLIVDQKNYNAAASQLEKLDPAKVEREFIKQDIMYYKALVAAKLALTEGGNKTDAASAMYKFYKAYPASHHFYEASEVLGDLGVATGRYDVAATFYGDTGLGGAPWPEYKLRAGILSGRALLLAGKYEDAAKAFDTVAASQETSAEANAIKQHALVGKAQCLAESGKADEGIALLNDIVKKNDPQLDGKLFARAYNALGNCYLKQSKPKDAVMAFLETDLLFFKDADAHAEALAKLAKLWDETGHADRATVARNTLRDRYSGSIWATK